MLALFKRSNQAPFRAIALLVAFLSATSALAADEADPQLILNAGVAAPPSLSANTLRAIFSGRMQTWPDGTPVKVFVLPENHPLHKRFCLTYLRTFPYVLKNHWDQLTFTGAGMAPEEVATTYQLHQKVKATPGAIGYANRVPGNTEPLKLLGNFDTQTKGKTRF